MFWSWVKCKHSFRIPAGLRSEKTGNWFTWASDSNVPRSTNAPKHQEVFFANSNSQKVLKAGSMNLPKSLFNRYHRISSSALSFTNLFLISSAFCKSRWSFTYDSAFQIRNPKGSPKLQLTSLTTPFFALVAVKKTDDDVEYYLRLVGTSGEKVGPHAISYTDKKSNGKIGHLRKPPKRTY